MKKATMKDIARLANVSVATVSYVLNNVKNQTIPEPTRESILQVAKELNYVPNLAARSLVKQRTGLVGILINKTAGLPYWKRHSYSALVEGLETMLTLAGYHALVVSLNPQDPYLDIIRERKLDAVFLVDVKDELFYRISANFVEGIPLILIDSLIEDPLFNQVNYNYHRALQLALASSPAPPCLILEGYHNQALVESMMSASTLSRELIHTVNDAEDLAKLDAFLKVNEGKHIIVMNEFLGNAVERSSFKGPLTVVCTCGIPEILDKDTTKVQFRNNRAATAFELMESLIREHGNYSSSPINKFLVEVLE